MSHKPKQPLSKLVEVDDLKQVWPHEALNFTPWLAKNVDLLSEAIGTDIEVEERESNVGSFRVDIVAKELNSGRRVIIENQLEDTNHDHLGKIITYAAGKDADIIIWVVKKAREEHRAAVEWLNNHTNDRISFFLCEIKLYRIDNSPLAVKFDVVERPNDWIKKPKQDINDTQRIRYEYWKAFCEYAEKDNAFMAEFVKVPKASYDHWVTLRIGTRRCHLDLLNIQRDGEIGVSIYVGNDQEYFDTLEQNKREIENDMGCQLKWINDTTKTASSVRIVKKANVRSEEDWENQFTWMIEQAIKMKKIAKEHLNQIAS